MLTFTYRVFLRNEIILTSIVPPNPTTTPSTTNMLDQNGPSRATLSGSFRNYEEERIIVANQSINQSVS